MSELSMRPSRTKLGKLLWKLRERIVQSGARMLTWDGVAREVNIRRGER